MKIELNHNNEKLYPLTNTIYTIGINNYSLNQIIDSYKNSISECYTTLTNILVMHEKIDVININDFTKELKDYKLDLIYNGFLLTEGVDYFTSKDKVYLNFVTEINDNITFKFLVKLKDNVKDDVKDNNISSEYNEKILINNIFNRINSYAKAIERR